MSKYPALSVANFEFETGNIAARALACVRLCSSTQLPGFKKYREYDYNENHCAKSGKESF